MIIKICKRHGELSEGQVAKEPANWTTKSGEKKIGFQLRCIECRRDKDRKYKLNNPEKSKLSSGRARKEARRLFREGLTDIEPIANIWAKKDRLIKHDYYLKKEKERRLREGQSRNTKEVCRRFKLDVSDYYKMLAAQNGKCAICGFEETRQSRTQGKTCALAIDHCHRSGKIRELLCHSCNTGIGKFMDSIELMKKAISYLAKYEHVK